MCMIKLLGRGNSGGMAEHAEEDDEDELDVLGSATVSAAARTQLSITQLRSIYKQRARHPNLGDAIRPHQQVRARVTGDDGRLSLRERPRDMLDRGFESVKGRALASITPPIRSICAAKVDHDA